MKKSETIQKQARQSDLAAEQAELKVMINGQPHSVGLDDLGKEDKNGFYHVSLKVDPKLLQKNRYIDIQFATSGLKENNPCYAETVTSGFSSINRVHCLTMSATRQLQPIFKSGRFPTREIRTTKR